MAAVSLQANKINLNAMGLFNQVSNAKGKYTVTLTKEGGMSSGGKLNPLATKRVRSSAAIEANNSVRMKLLENIARAFNLKREDYVQSEDERTHEIFEYKADFLKAIKANLGDVLKMGDFGIDLKTGGAVTSGKPLTERRVMAVLNKLAKLKGESVSAEQATADHSSAMRLVAEDAFIRYFGEEGSGHLKNALIDKFLGFDNNKLHASVNDADILKGEKLGKELDSFWTKIHNELLKCKSLPEILAKEKEAESKLTKLLKNSGAVRLDYADEVVTFGFSKGDADSDESEDGGDYY